MAPVLDPRRVAGDETRPRGGGQRYAGSAVQADEHCICQLHPRTGQDAGIMTSSTPTQEFPSEFPIKVMGRQGSDLRVLTQAIIERHAGPIAESRVKTRTSAAGNFLALTYMVLATSREQLDTIYRELTACKSVLMAL